MLARLLALVFIFVCTSVAWMILGNTISRRTTMADAQLRGRVESVWGAPQAQLAPTATDSSRTFRPASSDIDVDLTLEHRKKGLLWYSTYTVAFAGDYRFRNDGAEPGQIEFWWMFPAQHAIYDGLEFQLDGAAVTPELAAQRAIVKKELAPGQEALLHLAYRSQGLDSWSYRFGNEISSLPDFDLHVTTNFRNVDFADDTLAPTTKQEAGNGWELEWRYSNLFSGHEIAVLMPEKAQPGPLAAQISFFAPVSLLFFFFLVFMITTMRGMELHPMNYFFLACAFFAFHLLLAYLVDHVDIYVSFAISAAVSVALVVTYLRIVTGPRFAWREAAITQLVYLVLFSFAFFFRGLTGLAITIGSILTLFVVMQMTARVRWAERFGSAPPPVPAGTKS